MPVERRPAHTDNMGDALQGVLTAGVHVSGDGEPVGWVKADGRPPSRPLALAAVSTAMVNLLASKPANISDKRGGDLGTEQHLASPSCRHRPMR